MNLIDKDSVVATIKKHLEEERHSYFCKCLLSEIDSLNVEEQPSLPSDLDEAAEEYADYNSRMWHEDGDVYYDHSKIMDAFKAGAEWMAGQGTTVRKKIGKIDDGVNQIPTYCNGFEVTELDVPFLNSKECGYGNEVIVQIRKKQ